MLVELAWEEEGRKLGLGAGELGEMTSFMWLGLG